MGDVEGEGAAGVALVDGGVLTAGVGPRHSWWRYPWVSLARVLARLVSLMPMVLYRAVSPWRLPLTLWFVVAEAGVGVGEVVVGAAMVHGVSDVADAAGGWRGSVCGWSAACVQGGGRFLWLCLGGCAVGGVVCW